MLIGAEGARLLLEMRVKGDPVSSRSSEKAPETAGTETTGGLTETIIFRIGKIIKKSRHLLLAGLLLGACCFKQKFK
jgi:hypothetical protein